MKTDLIIEAKPPSELAPGFYNLRAISPEALAAMRNSVERFGLVEPVVWSRRTQAGGVKIKKGRDRLHSSTRGAATSPGHCSGGWMGVGHLAPQRPSSPSITR